MEEPAIVQPTSEENPRSGSCLVRGLIVLGVLVIAIILAVLWYNRPIRPVVLTEPEKAVVEQKIAAMQVPAESPPASIDATEGGTTATETTESYQPGKREIAFTDRELNGLLNEQTGLGDQISFQFTPGVVVARIATPLPEDVPILGGTTLRAHAKFAVDPSGASPKLALEDFTVWGISLPNDWLGGIKNLNLLDQAFGAEDNKGIPGVESLTIEKGRLLIRLKE